MKKTATLITALILFLSLLSACGGVLGNHNKFIHDNDSDTQSVSDSGKGNDDAGGTNSSAAVVSEDTGGLLNPPSWFIGEWEKSTGPDSPIDGKIKVTEHNVVIGSSLDFTWQVEHNRITLEEISEGDVYCLEYVYSDTGTEVSYTFTKQDDGGVIRRTDMGGAAGKDTLYTKSSG